jgi:hypothetical protein
MPTDSINATLAQPVRTCSANLAHTEPVTLPLTEANFFHRARPNGTVYIENRCQACRRHRDREVRRLRAEGRAVRGSRRQSVATRKFGVEIEYIGAYAELIRQMESRGLSASYEGYTHQVRRNSWKIVRDGSISGGYELVSPPLSGAAGFREVELACEALAAAGCRVNSTCGLHVHHEIKDLTLDGFKRLIRGWYVNQDNTNRLVARSRRNSTWARPFTEGDLRYVDSLRSLDQDAVRRHFVEQRLTRYKALNAQAFGRYGTIEVRQHQGTMNFKKIAAWIRYGQAFIAAASAGEIAIAATTGDLLDALSGFGLDAPTVSYLRSRADHFAGTRVAA